MHVSVWLCFSCNHLVASRFLYLTPGNRMALRYAIAFLFAWVVLVFKSGTDRPAFMCQIVTWTSGCLHLCTKCMSLPSWNSLSKCQMCDSILYCMHRAPYSWLCNDAYVYAAYFGCLMLEFEPSPLRIYLCPLCMPSVVLRFVLSSSLTVFHSIISI